MAAVSKIRILDFPLYSFPVGPQSRHGIPGVRFCPREDALYKFKASPSSFSQSTCLIGSSVDEFKTHFEGVKPLIYFHIWINHWNLSKGFRLHFSGERHLEMEGGSYEGFKRCLILKIDQ